MSDNEFRHLKLRSWNPLLLTGDSGQFASLLYAYFRAASTVDDVSFILFLLGAYWGMELSREN
jgi:hypothetical protein